MINVTCAITLVSDNNRKVDIQLRKEDDGKLLWKVVESSRGSLVLPALSGTWFDADFANILTLFYTSKKSSEECLMLVAYNVKYDFLQEIMNGKAIETNDADFYNSNYTEQKVSCKLWKG